MSGKLPKPEQEEERADPRHNEDESHQRTEMLERRIDHDQVIVDEDENPQKKKKDEERSDEFPKLLHNYLPKKRQRTQLQYTP